MRGCSRSAPLNAACSPAATVRRTLGLCLGVLLAAGPGVAADLDPFAGFDDLPVADLAETGRPASVFAPYLGGFAKLGVGVNTAHRAPKAQETDWRGLSRLRAELQLEGDFRPRWGKVFVSAKGSYDGVYAVHGRDSYTPQVLDVDEGEVELGEAFVEGSLSARLDLKLGRQIVVWGRSDTFRVTDLLNPLDLRQPGMTDIEDLRLPVAMSKMDYYRGPWQLSLLQVLEQRFSKLPPFGSDFYPAPIPPPHERLPAATFANSGLALEAKALFAGGDISFYGANLYADQTSFVPSLPVALEHRRIRMAGMAMNVARGNFLYLLEAAHRRGLRFMADYPRDYARTDLLAGVEYRGLADTAISLDLLLRHLHHFRAPLAASPEGPVRDESEAALRLDRQLFHDRLTLGVLLLLKGEGAREGGMQRFTATYDLVDGWSLTGGVVVYHAGEGDMARVGDNDRLWLEVRYDF